MCKLKSAAIYYWNSVERQLYRTYSRLIETWDEMKEKLKEKFIPSRSRVFKKLFYLCQGDLSVKHAFLLALELELSTFKTREWCSTCEEYEHYVYECPSIKCSKGREFEHYDYQCPSKTVIM